MVARVTELTFTLFVQGRIDLKVGGRQVVQQDIEADVEQIAPAPHQMIKQCRLVLEQQIVTVVEHMLIDHAVRPQQVRQSTAPVPLTMQAPFAAGRQQSIHHQNQQYVAPARAFARRQQTLAPELGHSCKSGAFVGKCATMGCRQKVDPFSGEDSSVARIEAEFLTTSEAPAAECAAAMAMAFRPGLVSHGLPKEDEFSLLKSLASCMTETHNQPSLPVEPPHPEAGSLSDHISQNIESVVALRKREWGTVTPFQRRLERVSRFVARPLYLLGLLSFVVLWIIVNSGAAFLPFVPFDPPPFAWLEGLLTFVALLTTTVVLIAQNRQTKFEQQRAELDLQVNLLTEQKVTKVIHLLEELRRDLPMVKDRHDPQASAMQERADTALVASALEDITRKSEAGNAET
ncbi:MAG: hypothetical protein JWM63_4707 [Gammaproteobacteria bacterium]|nr:hypothetical protein [Gammaproteobacteria bacterium]